MHEPGAGGEGEKQASKGTQQTSAPQKVKSLTANDFERQTLQGWPVTFFSMGAEKFAPHYAAIS